jgi:hypothetical protein
LSNSFFLVNGFALLVISGIHLGMMLVMVMPCLGWPASPTQATPAPKGS